MALADKEVQRILLVVNSMEVSIELIRRQLAYCKHTLTKDDSTTKMVYQAGYGRNTKSEKYDLFAQ